VALVEIHPAIIDVRRVNEPRVRLPVAKCSSGRGALSAWGFTRDSLGSVKMGGGPVPTSTTTKWSCASLNGTGAGPFHRRFIKAGQDEDGSAPPSHGAGAGP
jgi:hypothetical protein